MCPCRQRDWQDHAVYTLWRAWDRLCEKALQAWEIRTVSGDPLIQDPVPSPPPLVAPAAAEPVEPEGRDNLPAPGGREVDLVGLEYWRAKANEFDMRHPSLLGPL